MTVESQRPPSAAHPALSPLRFLSVEAASGLVLLLAAAVAFAWANSAWVSGYETLWHLKIPLALGSLLPEHDLRFWVNDGLMTVFFLLVGLEIRRELHDGTLSDLRVAALPIIAALGGVIVPALFYLAINTEPLVRRGWAIPTATDIAFAVGVLALLGKRVPRAVRMLLLTLAIADDIVAILVIACFYSSGIGIAGLLIAAAGIGAALFLQWLSIDAVPPYLLPGALVWLGLLHAGIHPALAGVVLGLLTPATIAFGRGKPAPRLVRTASPVERVEAMLHPWVAFGIMPVFALANAGVTLRGLDLSGGAALAVTGGVLLGLIAGKPIGIVLAAGAAVRLGLAALPEATGWRHMVLLGVLGGIGFTMSIFISDLAFEESALLSAAKLAVLVASAIAALLGIVFGRLALPGESLNARG